MRTLSFEPTGGPLGAFVHGLDFDDIDGPSVREALNRYRLLCFRGRAISDDEHAALASSLGHLAQEGRTITLVSNVAPGGALGPDAASWHSDYMFYPAPYEYISLYALELPAAGTQTRFVDAVAAARTLPARLRSAVAGLEGRAVADLSPRSPGQAGIVYLDGRRDGVNPHFLRPVLWPHPGTGEEILAIWHQQTDAILPLPQEDSVALLSELFAHLYQPASQYVHQWQAHDLVIWDNRACQHSRPHVGTSEPRTLRRISVGEDQDLSIFFSPPPA
ncbi:MAG TPA: TauD/TfdA family dioxygenase [Trebonia sp.]|nr:TauD/TfdA family dioxygenase [Trebonia sp.]